MLALLYAACLPAGAQTATHGLWFCTTEDSVWQTKTITLEDKVTGVAEFTIDPQQQAQTFKGWGTCFNELGWDALNLLPQDVQDQFMSRMFAPNGDLRLSIGRLSTGANDYARSWYSCNETDGDFAMEHFNIDRDKETLIPYIKYAQRYNPDMTFWCSPWSPPTWMKTNKHYANRSGANNGLDKANEVPVYFNDQFIMQPEYLQAYALYFSRFIEAYAEQGIPITTLMYQNEAYSFTVYPSCSWTAQGTARFLGEYLGPYFAEHHPEVELIVGTMNTGSLDVFEEILSHPGVTQYCKGVGFQWEGRNALREIAYRHPELTLQQTESECGSGTFDWAAAEHTFYLINQYVGSGCEKYTYWNAILKDNGASTWGWIQNALIQVDSKTGTARITPEYYALKHYSHFVPAGSTLLQGASLGTDHKVLLLAFALPNGDITVVAGNREGSAQRIGLSVAGSYLQATLPAHSFNTFVVGSTNSRLQLLIDEAKYREEGNETLTQALAEAERALQDNNEDMKETAIATLTGALALADKDTDKDSEELERAALQALLSKAAVMESLSLPGLEEYRLAVTAAQQALADENASMAEAHTALTQASATYLSTAEASGEAPSDFSALIINRDFSDWANGWTVDNMAVSGDFRANTVMGRTCYNNWSNNFTSLNVYQDLEGMAPGLYSLTVHSLCGEGETTDQHAYLSSGEATAVSPAKVIGQWAESGWEEQTTTRLQVGYDGKLRVGYASTSGGGTKGWYCVTGFTLRYHGADTDLLRHTLAEACTEANALLNTALLPAHKSQLKDALDQANDMLASAEIHSLQEWTQAQETLSRAMTQVRDSNPQMQTLNEQTLPTLAQIKESTSDETIHNSIDQLTQAWTQRVEAADATTSTVVMAIEVLNADCTLFDTVLEAQRTSQDSRYDADSRAQLSALTSEVLATATGVDQAELIQNLVRQLQQAITGVLLTLQPAYNADFSFAIRSANVETFGADGLPAGWELNLTNGDAKVKTGQHYSGNTGNHYFDSYHGTPGWLYYTGHQRLNGLPTGTYKLVCAARSSGEGAYITARTTEEFLMQQIGNYSNVGGPMWQDAPEGSAEKAVNGGKGFGWQEITISPIVVKDGILDIGFSNDKYLTGQEWTGTWFSADDFRLYFISDDITRSPQLHQDGDSQLRARGGKGCIHIYSNQPYRIYNVAGIEQAGPNALGAGLYIVTSGSERTKVVVK